MDQREHQEERQVDFYVLPVVGGAIAGLIIAERINGSGVLGTLIGAFLVDAFRGLRGTHRFVKETEHLVEQARNVWQKQKGQRTTGATPADEKRPFQPPADEEPANGEIYPSA